MALVNVVNVGDPFGKGRPWYMHYCGNCGYTLQAGVDKSCERCGEIVEYPPEPRDLTNGATDTASHPLHGLLTAVQ